MTLDSIISSFPEDFTFGCATSSYQIEGTKFGGCGVSHWDTFARENGRVVNNENGEVACNHYNLFDDDLKLLAATGFDAYRFSLSWTRLLPESCDNINPEAISFYDRLIDTMLDLGLRPFATLYHWDLPIRHAEAGGWCNRDITHYFADYCEVVMKHFGDRLESIAPINEPWCVSFLSHYWGHHAPGMRDLTATAASMHYVQLAHGMAINRLRELGHKNLGCVLNKEFSVPIDDSKTAIDAAKLFDGIYNRWFEDSIFKGEYPSDVLAIFNQVMPQNYQDDLSIISTPLDWVGVNYYTRSVIEPDASEPNIGFRCTQGSLPKTDMNWEIEPQGLKFFIRRLANEYCPNVPIYITENGMANRDNIISGEIIDTNRIEYFESHLSQVLDLLSENINVKGYFAWSFLDNFEWAFGYSKRFGLVHVDYETQTRTPKSSYYEWQKGLKAR